MADAFLLAEAPVKGAAAGHWLTRRLVLMLAGGILFLSLISGVAWGTGLFSALFGGSASAQSISFALPPAVERDLLASTSGEAAARQFEGEAAQKVNASLPFTKAPLEAATPFSLGPTVGSDKDRALLCLTQAVYYEAGFEPIDGRRAVAQVVLNRLRHPVFPKTVCGVVYQGSSRPGCQFSFTCDGSLRRPPAAAAWNEARRVAEEALAGYVAADVGEATHYHANYVSPYWAPKLAKLTQIGAHIFYRWPGGWGQKGAFTGRYAGSEYIPAYVPPSNDSGLMTAEQAAVTPQAPDDHHAPEDVGGRLDVSKGWTLNIPMPNDSGGAMQRALASQGQAGGAQAAQGVVALNNGGKGSLQ